MNKQISTIIALTLYCSSHYMNGMENYLNLKTPEDFHNALAHIGLARIGIGRLDLNVKTYDITPQQENDLKKLIFLDLNKEYKETTLYLGISQENFSKIEKCSKEHHMSIQRAFTLYINLKNK